MKQKVCMTGAALTLILLLLAGCGGPAGGETSQPPADAVPAASQAPEIPALEPMDTSGLTMTKARGAGFSFSYPDPLWYCGEEGTAPMSLYLTEALERDYVCNLNVQLTAPYDGVLTEKDRQEMIDALAEVNDGYMTVTLSELRQLNGETLFYTEETLKFTEEYIDMLVDMGYFTEEGLAELGGREVLLAIPPTDQIIVHAVRDGHLFTLSGTYYSPADKEQVLDLITALIPTLDVD